MIENSEDETPPLGLSQEIWQAMLADVRKQEAANKKRSETMKLRAAVKKAEQLLHPPKSIKEAWRRHADNCPHFPMSPEAKSWFRENLSFEFDGTRWRREVNRQLSNSGKTRPIKSIIYYAEDGRTIIEQDEGPNRRSDPKRDYGLPD